jgi:hypothetical protein
MISCFSPVYMLKTAIFSIETGIDIILRDSLVQEFPASLFANVQNSAGIVRLVCVL